MVFTYWCGNNAVTSGDVTYEGFHPMPPTDTSTLLQGTAGERLAHLPARTTTRALAQTLAALANFNGGDLLLGSTSAAKGAAEDTTALHDKVLQACLLVVPPLILPAARTIANASGEAFVHVNVPAGLPNVYNVQGVYHTRMGAHNRPLTTPELRRLLLDRAESGFEAQTVEGATVDDLDPQHIERYLDRLMLQPADLAQGGWQATLHARGCLPASEANAFQPTVAGILLFGRNPQRFVRSAEIVCVRYGSDNMADEFIRLEITGALPEQIRQAEAFVAANMRRGMRITGLAREEAAEYPLPVVREAIVNAVAHRDYSVRGEGIRLLLFSNRLEIYSPGRLPGHVTLDNLKDERYSRNEAIVAILSDLGYIERLGYGVDRMYNAMRAAGLADPTFVETTAGFQVTLYAAPEIAGVPPGNLARTAPNTEPGGWLDLNDRQQAALEIARTQGRVTNGDMLERTPDVSAETIRRDLADLVEKNLLLRIGSKRATYYILK
jgi:ATP-dependent DNA helicase RecG